MGCVAGSSGGSGVMPVALCPWYIGLSAQLSASIKAVSQHAVLCSQSKGCNMSCYLCHGERTCVSPRPEELCWLGQELLGRSPKPDRSGVRPSTAQTLLSCRMAGRVVS